jgi:hypothetical protein
MGVLEALTSRNRDVAASAWLFQGRIPADSERSPTVFNAGHTSAIQVLARFGAAARGDPRAIYVGRVAGYQAKQHDKMQAVADALSLLANIAMAWNTMKMQSVLDDSRRAQRVNHFPPYRELSTALATKRKPRRPSCTVA